MVFKQIAGLIARRIVFRKKPGDKVAAGERVGLIKFGSRVDVISARNGRSWCSPECGSAAGSSIIARRDASGRMRLNGLKGTADRPAVARAPAAPRRLRPAHALHRRQYFLGYISILRSFRGAMLAASGAAGAPEHFVMAAQGHRSRRHSSTASTARIARMTNTTSEFGREMDSLADVISFGIAPAVLAFAWGVQFVDIAIGRRNSASILRRRILHRVPVPAVRRRAPGALQHPEESRFPRIPAGPTANISSACRFPRAAAHGGRRGIRAATASRCTGGRFSVAWLALLAAARLPDGEHLALLQLQGHQPAASPYTPLIVILLGGLIYVHLELRRSWCCW